MSLPLPPDVPATLARLRGRIRRYLLWEGLALWVVLAGLLFWGTFLIDWAYFGLSRLELPRWWRAGVFFGGLVALAAGGISWLGLRLLRGLRTRSLALLLERRFPELDDGLITAVEAAEGVRSTSGELGDALLARTINDAGRKLQRLDLAAVFNPLPLRRSIVAAIVLAGSIVGFAVVNGAAMDRWLAGYWRLESSYWPRETVLIVQAVTQPGDRLRDFTDQRYRHPRGGDLQLQFVAAEGKRTPERVRLDYRLRGASWKRAYLTPTDDGRFLQGFPGLLDDLEFWVTGGDFASPQAWRVEIVEPPRLEALELQALYPNYTGLNLPPEQGRPTRTAIPLLGSQQTLPLGTEALFVGRANKPLAGVRIEFDAAGERMEWSLRREAPEGPVAGLLTIRAKDDQPQLVLPWTPPEALAADGLTFRFPFQLLRDGEALLRERAAAGLDATLPLPWPADPAVRIHLEDVDGIASPEPLRLVLNAQVDQPPVVEVGLQGISNAITRQARIPFVGQLRDEYGLASARFEYVVDQATEWQARDLVNPPPPASREFTLSRSPGEAFEPFDVLPLDLSLKQRLTITVHATDGDTLYGPNEQRSQKFVFNIVSVEELLSLLYAKELNLRKRFEQIVTELKSLQGDLQAHRERAGTVMTQTGESRQQTAGELLACGERSLLAVRKNAAELLAVEQAFREIRDELVNNAAETPQNMARLEAKILGPLSGVNTTGLPGVDATLGLFSLANQKGQDPGPPLDRSQTELAGVIQTLEQVLLEMRRLETVQEALELLKAIMAGHDELTEETKTERKARALKALE